MVVFLKTIHYNRLDLLSKLALEFLKTVEKLPRYNHNGDAKISLVG